ncbi:MAG TPA: cysteine dioxygenase family protein [Rubrobacter sp.]|nr:cysteine dioxygenase family protein [Rubrobacter sp.]
MNPGTMTLLALDTNNLQKVCELPTELALQQASPFLARLVKDHTFLEAEIRPLLEGVRGTGGNWYVAKRYEGEDHSYSLQVFVWPPGTETKIHDHSSWGVYCCAVGSVLEERYERFDDGSRLDHARLEKIWQLMWSREDGASSFLPGNGGIHRIGNLGDSVAISVHLYGPRIGKVDGRDYDLSCDYVCDRREE